MSSLPSDAADAVRAIAFYLPQFHPVPENDAWWGKGFTEWTNVTKARSQFPGHYQPQLPTDLGFYDLRLPEVREEQAALARRYGIHGFCYYHYWFSGRRILERPFNEVLASGKPDFPFCLAWANESWGRNWDGKHHDLLMEQKYAPEDPQRMLEELLPAFHDPRYIRIDNRPLFLVYRIEHLPDARAATQRWREVAKANGLDGLYLACVQSFRDDLVPADYGCDAAIEFPPGGDLKIDAWWQGSPLRSHTVRRLMSRLGLLARGKAENSVFEYSALVDAAMKRPSVAYRRYRGVVPGWDNSSRRPQGRAKIFINNTPAAYEDWLRRIVEQARREQPPGERLVFINAWNEWAEGAHLEPCRKFGHGFLEATQRALQP
ncbi:glycoside hydrolase family 99-like domain-containing protein [Nevskia sp.]|uniref:glycoside hydrolase family 99-like domain-containing protein n=1 Tax=Nevskia sp. TaxID=1929292 RepID=UPI0025EA509E|nr:glycoside hydrolase family 99-like domain-containing protein [Nevskia sp.]